MTFVYDLEDGMRPDPEARESIVVKGHHYVHVAACPCPQQKAATAKIETECLCEGEFIWACGPECECWHHA